MHTHLTEQFLKDHDAADGSIYPCIQLTHSDMGIQLDKEQATQLVQRFNLS